MKLAVKTTTPTSYLAVLEFNTGVRAEQICVLFGKQSPLKRKTACSIKCHLKSVVVHSNLFIDQLLTHRRN
jgi:hypothetical protein